MSKRSTSVSSPALSVAIAVYLGVHVLASAFPQARMWGADSFRFLPPALSVLISLALIALAVPAVQRWISERTALLPERMWSLGFYAACAVFLVAIVLWPMETWYYGDGGPLVSEVYKIGNTPSYASEIILNTKSSPLTGLVLDALTRGIPPVLAALGLPRPETTLFPFFTLALLSFLVLAVAVMMLSGTRERVLLLAVLTGSAGTLLFFSYVEFYVTVYVALAVFVLAGMRHVETGASLWKPLLAWAVAVGMHVYSLALLPALLYLIVWRNEAIRKRLTTVNVLLLPAFSIALAAALYVAFGFAHGSSRIVMPFFPLETAAGVQAYTILSAAHIVDLANLLFLLAPIPVLFLMFTARKDGHVWSQPAVQFSWLAASFFFVFLIFANTSLGLARDWDLAAPLGILTALLAYAAARGVQASASAMPVLAKAAVLAVLPWLFVQVDAGTATARFESVMTQDAQMVFSDYALSGYEALRKHYMHDGDAADELRIVQRMIEVPGYAEQYRMYLHSSVTRALKDASSFRSEQEWMLASLQRRAALLRARGIVRDYHISLRQIDSLAAASAYNAFGTATHEELTPVIRAFSAATGLPTAARVLDGIEAFITNRYGDVISPLRAVMDSGFVAPRLSGMLGSSLVAIGRIDEADRVFARGEQLFPHDAEQLFLRAAAYLRIGVRGDEAVNLLRRARTITEAGTARDQVDELLRELGETP